MALSVVGVSSANTGSANAATITIPKPAGVINGDLLIAALSIDNESMWVSPSGTGFALLDNGEANWLEVFAKGAGPSEPDDYTFTASTPEGMTGAIIALRDAGDIVAVAAHETSSTTHPLPGVNGVADALLIGCWGWGHAAGLSPISVPAGMTQQVWEQSSNDFHPSVAIATELLTTTGAIGTKTLNTNSPRSGSAIALVITDGSAPSDEEAPTISIDPIHGSGQAASVHEASGYDRFTEWMTVTGVADDNVGVASVEVRIDGGAWETAVPTATEFATWSFSFDLAELDLADSPHTVEARAADAIGNIGVATSRTFHYSPSGLWGWAGTGQHLTPLTPQSWDGT